MRIEKIDESKLINSEFLNSLNLKFSLEYFNDKVLLRKSFNGVNMKDLQEGRYFNENVEVRVIKINGKYNSTLFIEEKCDKTFLVDHLVINNKFGDIKKIGLKKYIDYDEDGQGYIRYQRPYKVI